MLMLILLIVSLIFWPWYITAVIVMVGVLIWLGQIGAAGQEFDRRWKEHNKMYGDD